MRQVPVYILLLFISYSCKKTSTTTPPTRQVTTNVSYGPDPSQKMDVYVPISQTGSSKALITIHGGAWSTGDKTDFDSLINAIADQLPDYVIFNINYRLANGTGNKFPAQENDVNAAVEYIFNNKSQYNIGDKFVLAGESAGAHLAQLQAYKHTSVVAPKALISFFGPTDLPAMYDNSPNPAVPLLLLFALGNTPTGDPTLYHDSSPINYVSQTSCPTIILQGGRDSLVDASQSFALRARLEAYTIVDQFVFYPGEGHGWGGSDLQDSIDKIIKFLQDNVK